MPELFLAKDQIHAGRLLDFILFVFRSVFRMQMDQLFIDYCTKLQTRSRTLPQFLVPFISILTNLYNAISELSSPANSTTGRDDWESRLTAVTAAQNLSPDLSRLNDILNSKAAAHLDEEEVKGGNQDGDESDGEIDTIAQIQSQMPSSLKPA